MKVTRREQQQGELTGTLISYKVLPEKQNQILLVKLGWRFYQSNDQYSDFASAKGFLDSLIQNGTKNIKFDGVTENKHLLFDYEKNKNFNLEPSFYLLSENNFVFYYKHACPVEKVGVIDGFQHYRFVFKQANITSQLELVFKLPPKELPPKEEPTKKEFTIRPYVEQNAETYHAKPEVKYEEYNYLIKSKCDELIAPPTIASTSKCSNSSSKNKGLLRTTSKYVRETCNKIVP